MKLRFLIGLGAGYVLGARAGREAYDALLDRAQTLMGDERVQRLRGEVASAVDLGTESADRDTPTSGGTLTPPVVAGPGPQAGTRPKAPSAPATGSSPSSGAGTSAKPKGTTPASGPDSDVVLPDLTTTKASNITPSSGTKNPAKPVTPPSTDI